MSVVILGGNECMERNYCELCKKFGYSAKVFCKPCTNMKSRVGSPDLVVLFTNTVSHKIVRAVVDNLDKAITVVRSHSSSMASLQKILDENTAAC
ncbi:MAG: DUF2325 domain-containing protein [Lachnospiraceae bacterium]|jgi:hypothetical protein|nr:DUF2325 domain-containing protein [Lachnospiraceae bacterium]MBO7514187.1 DUF2325 domain-containing protein [Lachnospiraceae bacterium]MBQ3911346.1 DUF2325 domain-containing protein [Lachnospiraceae bacterium]